MGWVFEVSPNPRVDADGEPFSTTAGDGDRLRLMATIEEAMDWLLWRECEGGAVTIKLRRDPGVAEDDPPVPPPLAADGIEPSLGWLAWHEAHEDCPYFLGGPCEYPGDDAAGDALDYAVPLEDIDDAGDE